ncbi:DUF6150 family protein [Pedobacter soli]|uniref:7(1) septoil knot domain-containing protein n=1 Tax=Pedobacter soli TaxID=390242 RepID=A0A1G6ZDU2_9SPHI|nr:DUF6150 family protein [Pedobacter soli]SDE00642.1 hypothetical protein SAMN04488024_11066 [Pedobacter soli]
MARIYQCSTMGEARIRAAVVAEKVQADLLVYRVSSWGSASGDARWYITPEQQDATSLLFFTSIGMAELKIYFVSSAAEAGWQISHHRLKGKL